MIQNSVFKAAGIAAHHCDALRRSAPSAVDLVPGLEALGVKLAKTLEEDLCGFLSGEEPKVASLGVETLEEGALAKQIGTLAGNALLGIGTSRHNVLISIEPQAIFAELDRAFGGTGELDGNLPAAFPMSADLLASRLEERLSATLSGAVAGKCELRPAGRHASIEVLAPFAPGSELCVLTVKVSQPASPPWNIRIAMPADALPTLFAQRSSGNSASVEHVRADPMDTPFADVPVPIEATIVSMVMPVSRLAALEPGAVIPVSVARNVPLRIGETVIARGTVGELDDRIAVQITQALS